MAEPTRLRSGCRFGQGLHLCALIAYAAAVAAGCAIIAGSPPVCAQAVSLPSGTQGIPALRQDGEVTQLTIDGEPFLILSGETLNSTSSSIDTLEPVLKHMNANTLATPVTWERIEPEEGVFDFSLVDEVIQHARTHNLRLVLLWLATWKTGMSSYDPVQVKSDCTRFP